MIRVEVFTFNQFFENTYLLYDQTSEGIVVDPGCLQYSERRALQDFVEQNQIRLKGIYNTHCHIDHIFGVDFLKQKYGLKLYAHSFEQFNTENAAVFAQYMGIGGFSGCEIDEFLDDFEQIQFGESKLSLLFVPGHSPGHLAFYSQEDNFCISGDVLFWESVGRTDLPGGDRDTLEASIQDVMYSLPAETRVYSGHGQPTTIGHERNHNPFVRG
jgi:glyoxylase-like metal-dependent hydrolase (beta-lactamase superfamily II)